MRRGNPTPDPTTDWEENTTMTSSPTAQRAAMPKLMPRLVFVSLMMVGIVAHHPWLLGALVAVGGIAGALAWILKSTRQREGGRQLPR